MNGTSLDLPDVEMQKIKEMLTEKKKKKKQKPRGVYG